MPIFAGILLAAGILMLTVGTPESEGSVCRPYRCVAAGLGVGLLTGFLGVDGGFLIVPALIFFAGLNPRRAVGTSLGIIALNAAAGFAGQLGHVGMAIGTNISSRLPERALRDGFGVLLVALGLLLPALSPPHVS